MFARGRAAARLPAIVLLAALLPLAAAHLYLRQRWKAETAFGSAVNGIKQGQFDLAQRELANALELDPDNAHYNAHVALLHERMLGRGIEPFKLEPPTFSETEQGHLRAAVQAYRNTLRLNPHDDAAHHNLGWLYWSLRQDEQAEASMRRAVEIDGDAHLYRISLALLYELRGEKAAAAGEYETALYLSPGILDSRLFRDLRRRWPEQAEGMTASITARLEAKLREGFDPLVAGKLGRLYLQQQPERAFALLNDATRALPNLSRPWANLGRLYELRGDWERMHECYERAVFLDGSDIFSWYRLGLYYDGLNRTQDATRCYERVVNISLSPESIHSGRARRIYLSRYTLFDDIIPRGMLLYTGANIDLPTACRRLSEIYQAAGDHERAKRFAELGRKYALDFDFSAGASIHPDGDTHSKATVSFLQPRQRARNCV